MNASYELSIQDLAKALSEAVDRQQKEMDELRDTRLIILTANKRLMAQHRKLLILNDLTKSLALRIVENGKTYSVMDCI